MFHGYYYFHLYLLDQDGERYYQVKWVDTWVHEQALQGKCSHVIQAYWELRQKETYDKISKLICFSLIFEFASCVYCSFEFVVRR